MEDFSALDEARVVHFKWTYRSLGRDELNQLVASRATLEREAAAALDQVLAERGELPPEALARTYRGFGGYVARHFHGNFSLARSYWLHVFLLSSLAGAALVTLVRVTEPMLSATQLSIVLLAGAAVVIAIWVWGVVGAWRSSSKHADRGGRELWVVMAKVALALGVLRNVGELMALTPVFWDHAKVALGHQPGRPVELVVRADGKSLLLRGGINDHTADALERALRAAPGVTTVVLESEGGWIRQGRLIRDVIARRGLNTYVESECNSACTIAFLAGKDRAIAPGARLGFHAFRGLGNVRSMDSEKEVYGAAGLGERFIRRIASTSHTSLWYPSPTELLDQRVITRTSRGGETAALATTVKSRDEVRQAFLQHATYALVEAHYPGRFDAIVDAAWRALRAGRADMHVYAAARAELGALTRELLPGVNDATLLSFIVLLADQATALQPHAPDLCVETIFRLSGESMDLRELLPRSFAAREEALLRAMIETSSPRNALKAREGDVQAALRGLFPRMRPADVGAIRTLRKGDRTDLAAQCTAGIALLDTLIRQPAGERARRARILFAS